jgi:hypothetical protein
MSSLVGPACRVRTVSVCRAGLRMGRLDRLWPSKVLLFFYVLIFFLFLLISDFDFN